jgi:Patatin-like phospholipase
MGPPKAGLASWWKVPINLIFQKGCYPGDQFRDWIAKLLSSKITKQGEILMSDLNGAVIYASRRGPGTVTFDSNGQRRDSVAAFATRCSMSIPIFFVPQMIDGRRAYDGGLRNNFPVTRFQPAWPLRFEFRRNSRTRHALTRGELVPRVSLPRLAHAASRINPASSIKPAMNAFTPGANWSPRRFGFPNEKPPGRSCLG